MQFYCAKCLRDPKLLLRHQIRAMSAAGGAAPVRRHQTTPSGNVFYPTHRQTPSYQVPTGPTSEFASAPRRLADPDSFAEKAKAVSSKVEDWMDRYSQPIKPLLPAIGRFLIVCTFLEDAMRSAMRVLLLRVV
jgi:hypothetical protein